jgi:hypothetical protein
VVDFTPEEVRLNQSISKHRKWLAEKNLVPLAERDTNPKKLQTANEYHHWMTHAQSVPAEAGSHLGMLEYEEHSLGQISYHPDHPRAKAVLAGKYYPQGEPKPASLVAHEAEMKRRVQLPPQAQEARAKAVQQLGAAPRVNRFAATCASCGKTVAPGQGRIERGSSGYVTRHYNSA